MIVRHSHDALKDLPVAFLHFADRLADGFALCAGELWHEILSVLVLVAFALALVFWVAVKVAYLLKYLGHILSQVVLLLISGVRKLLHTLQEAIFAV